MRFSKLPEKDIYKFLNNINIKEELNLEKDSLFAIQKLYQSDIRSMINYLQCNHNIAYNYKVINNNVWEDILNDIKSKKDKNEDISVLSKDITDKFNKLSILYNINHKQVIINFIKFILKNKKQLLTRDFMNFLEYILRYQEINLTNYNTYIIVRLCNFI